MNALKKILHATDFGAESTVAFAHALRIALDAKARLYLLHVEDGKGGAHWTEFPHVREVLGRWGLLDPGKSPRAIETELGLHVAKVSIRAPNLREAIARFATEHGCDLLVLATHDRRGISGWLAGTVAGDVARAAPIASLFLPGSIDGFVDPQTGRAKLDAVLVPVDDEFNPTTALRQIDAALRVISPAARIAFLHVGDAAPALRDQNGVAYDLPISLRKGPVVETIIAAAGDFGAGLIAMPTAGRQGLFDALRGSTTERVLREGGFPVLAVPIGGI